MPTLYIVRGLPGSGKSTFAKSLGVFMVEADMFHMVDGKYNWEPKNVSAAHKWCKRQVYSAMIEGIDVAVSNTFTQSWEFVNYVDFAKTLGYTVKVYCCKGNFQNVHDVPEDVLEKMKNRFEQYDHETIITPDGVYEE